MCSVSQTIDIRVSAEWPSRAPHLYLVHTSSVNPRNRSIGATLLFSQVQAAQSHVDFQAESFLYAKGLPVDTVLNVMFLKQQV